MAIERFDPFREAVSLSDAMNSLFRESFVRPGNGALTGAALALPLDVRESENEFVIKASLPGVKPEEVQITVHGDVLSIRGETKAEEEKKGETWHVKERRYGTFQRSVSLTTPIDADKAQAQFEHGVLTLTLPKAEAAKPKQIKVARGPDEEEDPERVRWCGPLRRNRVGWQREPGSSSGTGRDQGRADGGVQKNRPLRAYSDAGSQRLGANHLPVSKHIRPDPSGSDLAFRPVGAG